MCNSFFCIYANELKDYRIRELQRTIEKLQEENKRLRLLCNKQEEDLKLFREIYIEVKE